jgi:hypothetical protein
MKNLETYASEKKDDEEVEITENQPLFDSEAPSLEPVTPQTATTRLWLVRVTGWQA